MKNPEIIIPIAEKDLITLKKNLPYILRYLEPPRIIIISGREASSIVGELDDRIEYINENNLIDGLSFPDLKDYLQKYGSEDRTGWYFHQFLKLGYAFICNSEYYISWDADTLPLKPVSMFENGSPVFDMKTEYHKPYFDTIQKLLKLDKENKDSFISEHMIFKTEFVKEMLQLLESSNKRWFYSIIEAINPGDILQAGFSEFETYGTYVTHYHPGKYRYRKINAIRDGKAVFGEIPDEEILSWLSKNYDTLSFEKWQDHLCFPSWHSYDTFRMLIPSSVYITLFEMYYKLYKRIT